MPRRKAAELARDKARKQVQNLFDQFKKPARAINVYGGYLLQIDGPEFFDDNDLTRLQVKLLPFDVSNTAIPNSAPSFFKPWSLAKLKRHPVDIEAMEGDGLESLKIGYDIPDIDIPGYEIPDENPMDSARDIEVFIDSQYFHVPRANLGPGAYERLCDHSRWRPVTLPHALLEYNQGIHPHHLAASSTRWQTQEIFEYGDDAPTPPHIMAITINGTKGNNTKLLRGELISILQLMVNRMGEEGHENDAIVPVLMFSIMSARHGRLLQAYSDGEHLIIQMTELLSCQDEESDFINHAFRYLMSEAVGDTSGLSDVTGIKAAV